MPNLRVINSAIKGRLVQAIQIRGKKRSRDSANLVFSPSHTSRGKPMKHIDVASIHERDVHDSTRAADNDAAEREARSSTPAYLDGPVFMALLLPLPLKLT